ncbi:hypothetical protein DCO45_16890 [Comamonas sp. JNW]|nr:hypothetical protein DCO45_16890 [Comamonas sp. JNW]
MPTIALISLNRLTPRTDGVGVFELHCAPRPVQLIDRQALPWGLTVTMRAPSKPQRLTRASELEVIEEPVNAVRTSKRIAVHFMPTFQSK